MSNSQEQSLDEDVVFLPVNESSPQFLFCEKERQAVERLLSAGPEAFYNFVVTEHSGCFLSSEEVSQISSWAQDYHFNQLQKETHRELGSTEPEDFCSTYFPSNSDTPTPDLDLGWPEKGPWAPNGNVTVHTSPPAEGEPHVREIIRWHLQNANKVIAIVTDRLSDNPILGDLHHAASRGVPIYIILNQRSIQENFKLIRLRHPNMRVRVLGGKTFCSRMGRMVVGEMKDKFLLVDLETVIHGSYSLTWTDAHLHRQLITVLSGSVVDSFDREFRTLFAASVPVPDTWKISGSPLEVPHPLKDLSHLRFHNHVPLEPEIISPPSPPADSLLDWEAMGVFQRDPCFPVSPRHQHEEIVPKESPLQNNMLFDKHTPVVNQFVIMKRVSENTSPVTNNVPEKSYNNAQPLLTNITTPEMAKREDGLKEKDLVRRYSLEKSTKLEDRTTKRFADTATDLKDTTAVLSPTRRERSKAILEEEPSMSETSPKVENSPSSRKPIILKLPQSDSFSSLSDLMKRLKTQQSTGPLKRGSKGTKSELSHSTMDLSVHKTDTNNVPVPKFKASCFDPDYMTPAIALMKKRNDDLKPVLYRSPKNFDPRERSRSSNYGLDWRKTLTEMDE